MGKYDKEHEEIRKSIDGASKYFDSLVDSFVPSEKDLYTAIEFYQKCKSSCRIVRIVVLAVCAAIIYFHLR